MDSQDKRNFDDSPSKDTQPGGSKRGRTTRSSIRSSSTRNLRPSFESLPSSSRTANLQSQASTSASTSSYRPDVEVDEDDEDEDDDQMLLDEEDVQVEEIIHQIEHNLDDLTRDEENIFREFEEEVAEQRAAEEAGEFVEIEYPVMDRAALFESHAKVLVSAWEDHFA
ncbi:hypothetical protein HYFRA_00003592 [Hymenoscyphus fraxineus]|uniref:Uncharacterized protein n=1 Tax=Hymenoscyphus fraxineus TaxID=746836 RepID=A0A9N9PW46_9HELO|nr:hypothetical protein HYFRA_00003592 [Hymenoscyphus fraxineus]